MKLTNEQIEHSIKSLSKRDDQMLAVQARTIKSYLSEILSLRKELEQAKKELEQVISEESDGVNGVV